MFSVSELKDVTTRFLLRATELHVKQLKAPVSLQSENSGAFRDIDFMKLTTLIASVKTLCSLRHI